MKYINGGFVEKIGFRADNTSGDASWIVLKTGHDLLAVTCSSEPEWECIFALADDTDYNRVRFSIMEAIVKCADAEELIGYLQEQFQEQFSDILVA